MLKILQLSDNDRLGARFNGHSLARYLRESGNQCNFLAFRDAMELGLTCQPMDDDNFTFCMAQGITQDQLRAIEINKYYESQALFYPFSYGLLFNKLFLDADVLHMHLIHNFFFDINHLPILSKLKPIVWTLHDPWALTGHCVHPGACEKWKSGCGGCPELGATFPIAKDTTALNWFYKKMIYQQTQLDIIVASQWMYDRVMSSPLFDFNDRHRLHLLPFGIDLKIFSPKNRTLAKRQLGIDPESTVVAFRFTKSEWKGFDHVEYCLKRLKTDRKITLLTLNNKGLLQDVRLDGIPVVELGICLDEDRLVTAYSAADIFLMPSSADSFGMMTWEAMACGSTCSVMAETALPEVVQADHGTGIVVRQGDSEDLLTQLNYLLENPDVCRCMGIRARELAEREFSKKKYVESSLAVYDSALSRHARTGEAEFVLAQQRELMPDYGCYTVDKASVIPASLSLLGSPVKKLLLRYAGILPSRMRKWGNRYFFRFFR